MLLVYDNRLTGSVPNEWREERLDSFGNRLVSVSMLFFVPIMMMMMIPLLETIGWGVVPEICPRLIIIILN
jgi:hypothetical protein